MSAGFNRGALAGIFGSGPGEPPGVVPVAPDKAGTVAGDEDFLYVWLLDGYAYTPEVVLRITDPPALAGATAEFLPDHWFLYQIPLGRGATAGVEEIGYEIEDTGGVDAGVVTVTVEPAWDAPLAVDDDLTIQAGAGHEDIPILANDDYDGIPAVAITSAPALGSAVVVGSGEASVIRYTPPATGQGGSASIGYSLSATRNLGSDTAAVAVTVQPAAPPPVPGPALGMRWSGTPTTADHDRYQAYHGQIYEFYRTDGMRDSKTNLANSTFQQDAARTFLTRFSPARGAVMWNWPVCTMNVGPFDRPDLRTAALDDAANGGMDATWRSALRHFVARGLTHQIFCLSIEGNGEWYPWGTGAHSSESGYAGRCDDAGEAFRRFVRVSREAEFAAYRDTWIYTFSPTLEAWRGGSAALDYFLAHAYPGRQYCDAAWPTWYDAPYGTNDISLAGASQATKDAKYTTRWNGSQIGWLTTFRNWCGGAAGDIPTGFHELGVFSRVDGGDGDVVNGDYCVQGADPADCTNQRDVPINYSQLHPVQGGMGDNWIFMRNMFDWAENPANYCIGVGHFHELYKHDCSGFYHLSNTPPAQSNRHPLAATTFYNRSRATGPLDIRASIAHCVARRPANFGA